MCPKPIHALKIALKLMVVAYSLMVTLVPLMAQTANLQIRIQDENGNPMRGYLLFRDSPPAFFSSVWSDEDTRQSYYRYFTSFEERTYTVFGSPAPHITDGTIYLRNADIRKASGEPWAVGKLGFVFFFWSEEASLSDTGTLEERIARCNRVTWWSVYLGEKEMSWRPEARQYVTVMSRRRWTESLSLEMHGGGLGYFPDHVEHGSFVLEPPIGAGGQIMAGDSARPPIMLVHGINGAADYWEGDAEYPIPFELRAREYPLWELYYGLGQENLTDSGEMMRRAVQQVLKESPASSKLDMVTHGYGGVVARRVLSTAPAARLQIRRLLMISPPHHGSYSAYRIHRGDGRETLALWSRNGIYGGRYADPNAPIYRDLSPGSEALLELDRAPEAFSLFSSGDDPEARVFVLAGKKMDIGAEAGHGEAPGYGDGVVSGSSASLRDVGVPLATIELTHREAPSAPEIVMATAYLADGADKLRAREIINFETPCGDLPRSGVVVDARGYDRCPTGIQAIRFKYSGAATKYDMEMRRNEGVDTFFLYDSRDSGYSYQPPGGNARDVGAPGLAFPFDGLEPTQAEVIVVCADLQPGEEFFVNVKGCQTNTFRLSELREPERKRLTVVASGGGMVRSTPAGIDCGATCSAEFTEGEVSLTAMPAAAFSSWGGACRGTSPVCRVDLASATTVVANFSEVSLSVETFEADPNPILIAPSQSLGRTLIRWKVLGTGARLNVRVNSVNGQSVTGPDAPMEGETWTGDWVRDGMEFFLVNEAGGAANVLAHMAARVQVAGVPVVEYFRSDPNPIILAAGQWMGKTKLQWKVKGAVVRLNIRVNSVTGPSLTGPDAALTGETETGDWVWDGMKFFLVNEAWGGADVLAQVVVRVEGEGRGRPLSGPLGMEFMQILPGEFVMGCSLGDSECNSNESPRHTVRITRDFQMGKHEVTQAQWEAVMDSNPSRFPGADRPVEQVGWSDIERFLERLNALGDGYHYRLPTEAEWEYAARAGTTLARYGSPDGIAWHVGNSGGQTRPVGGKPPNAWGLHDMIGNVWEWVDDWWYRRYTGGTVTDPWGPASGIFKVLRGAAYNSAGWALRVSIRGDYSAGTWAGNFGFRCVRVLLGDGAAPVLAGFRLSAESVTGGGKVTGTVDLAGPAPSGGVVVRLQRNTALAMMPDAVTVAAGRTSAQFTISTSDLRRTQIVTITASYGGLTRTVMLTVNPAADGGGPWTGPHGMEFVRIDPGEFVMGCSPGDTECGPTESPRHTVRITRGFQMGKYEVTQTQWEAEMGINPSYYRGADRPVTDVSWTDIQTFLQQLNARNDGYRYRLPTESEWEYAARAGTTGARYGDLNEIAWHQGNSGRRTQPVGGKQPNAWGLYDMIGNAWEWVADWWYRQYTSATMTDPRGPETGTYKMLRGGSGNSFTMSLRASDRVHSPPGVRTALYGFRCVRE
jgi:formylglycine-generating enzyme required for sulfatase activity/pimeloyl-ACP methyl ester carboxylesterase